VTNRKVAAAIQEEIAHITGVGRTSTSIRSLPRQSCRLTSTATRAGDLGLTTNDVGA